MNAILACSSEKRQLRPVHRPRREEGPVISTRAMREALTRDVDASERDLTALQDSISQRLGDSVAVLLRRARTSWDEYRKLECDAIRRAFAQGSMAPVAQLECWVELTDERRRFLDDEFNFTGPDSSSRATRSSRP
jgi:uncharacterized protein YecT (DUF1311 family)